MSHQGILRALSVNGFDQIIISCNASHLSVIGFEFNYLSLFLLIIYLRKAPLISVNSDGIPLGRTQPCSDIIQKKNSTKKRSFC